jgi:hypothetical protein
VVHDLGNQLDVRGFAVDLGVLAAEQGRRLRCRVEFVDEDASTVTRTLEKYQALLKGDLDGTALWNDLKVLNQLGVTRGTMRVKL